MGTESILESSIIARRASLFDCLDDDEGGGGGEEEAIVWTFERMGFERGRGHLLDVAPTAVVVAVAFCLDFLIFFSLNGPLKWFVLSTMNL